MDDVLPLDGRRNKSGYMPAYFYDPTDTRGLFFNNKTQMGGGEKTF